MEIKINIRKRVFSTTGGRQIEDKAGAPHYMNVWATPADLYGEELYQAMAAKLHEVLAFKLRYCKALEDMRGRAKDYFVEEVATGARYRIYHIDYSRGSREFVTLKCDLSGLTIAAVQNSFHLLWQRGQRDLRNTVRTGSLQRRVDAPQVHIRRHNERHTLIQCVIHCSICGRRNVMRLQDDFRQKSAVIGNAHDTEL